MASIEKQLRADFAQQMKTLLVPGSNVPVGQLVGCVYCLLDFDLLPLYVGQSAWRKERLRVRISRHVLGQRSDAAGRCFPPYETFAMLVYPMRQPATMNTTLSKTEHIRINKAEAQLYHQLARIDNPPLNEKLPSPPRGRPLRLPQPLTVPFTDDPDLWATLWDHDARVERWIDVIKTMANRVRAGGGTVDQRRVLRSQVERLSKLVLGAA